MARDDLEEALQSVKERLAHEVELRAKEGKEFADRLKEVHFAYLLVGVGYVAHLRNSLKEHDGILLPTTLHSIDGAARSGSARMAMLSRRSVHRLLVTHLPYAPRVFSMGCGSAVYCCIRRTPHNSSKLTVLSMLRRCVCVM